VVEVDHTRNKGEMMSNEIIEHKGSMSLVEIEKTANVFMQSGLFKDTRSLAVAVVKIMAGQEMGISPFTAMRGINIIQGQAAPNAGLTGALIQKHPDYNYRVIQADAKKVELEFHGKDLSGKPLVLGKVSYSIAEAQQAGLTGKDSWKKYPADMLFARCMTRGARRFCASVFMGSVYSAEELDGEIQDGDLLISGDDIVDVPAVEVDEQPEVVTEHPELQPDGNTPKNKKDWTGYYKFAKEHISKEEAQAYADEHGDAIKAYEAVAAMVAKTNNE
jgi:hypothetical protein